MAYVPLDLSSADPVVATFVKVSIEAYLKEAHFLLAATTPEDGPANHFPLACTMILLATVGATSALDNHQRTGKKRRDDRKHFLNCLDRNFPWDCITIEDGEFRSDNDRRVAVAEALYDVFRCPLVHSGGLVDGLAQAPKVMKTHPGHADMAIAEKRIEELAQAPSLKGQRLISLEHRRCVLHVDSFYWCVRRMVENYTRDPQAGARLRAHCGL
jgi:hypothetical protein